MKINVYRNEDILTTQGLDELLTVGEIRELEKLSRRIGNRLRRDEFLSGLDLHSFKRRR